MVLELGRVVVRELSRGSRRSRRSRGSAGKQRIEVEDEVAWFSRKTVAWGFGEIKRPGFLPNLEHNDPGI